jgi:ubiquinone/menaquinone biosynthesis C-methylase UbiE
MAGRASNLERIDWVIATLEIEPADRVLEIGFGPGVSIKRISMLAPDGLVVGIDHSDLMVERARRRNAAAIANKTVDVLSGSVSNLPRFDQPFDKILAINSMMFWDEPIERLKDLRFLLKPGGRIAIGMQPRSKGATDQIAIVIGHELVKQLTAAGFKDVRLETRRMKPVATVCALGFRRN